MMASDHPINQVILLFVVFKFPTSEERIATTSPCDGFIAPTDEAGETNCSIKQFDGPAIETTAEMQRMIMMAIAGTWTYAYPSAASKQSESSRSLILLEDLIKSTSPTMCASTSDRNLPMENSSTGRLK